MSRGSAVLGLVVAAVFTAGCSGSAADEPTRGTGQQGYVDANQSMTRITPGKRTAPVEASGSRLGGAGTLSVADYRGKVVVVNVWGSWCAPCRKEAPDLESASRSTTTTAQFLGITSKDPDPAPAEAFVRAFGVSYPSIYDPDGAVLLNFAPVLPMSAIPSTLVLDREGRVAARILGPISKITLVDLINDTAAGR